MRKMQYLLMPLEKSSEGTQITVLSNLGELSGRLHSYTDDMLYCIVFEFYSGRKNNIYVTINGHQPIRYARK